ncbi:hypothetical protein MLD38_039357 [Melastoma candidum]|uniref:Uncharacterized protein n=1 Tax=Melastoma candidum TaxID=119954 RepID=A0ACB9L246_9MYRT|nr:hypothetical protein MLD38_039357 [Melastoma candidum]
MREATPTSQASFWGGDAELLVSLVVLPVFLLNSSSNPSTTISSIATIAFDETDSNSSWDMFVGAVRNSLLFVAVVTVVTFVLVLLFYLRCTRFWRYYMVMLLNFAIVGVLVVFVSRKAIFVTRA